MISYRYYASMVQQCYFVILTKDGKNIGVNYVWTTQSEVGCHAIGYAGIYQYLGGNYGKNS